MLLEEVLQLSRGRFGTLFGEEVACVERLALHIGRVFAPDGLHVVGLLHHAASAPQCQERTFHLSRFILVLFVVDEVDGGGGPVVLAARVDRGLIEAAFIFGEGFGGEGFQRGTPASEFRPEVVSRIVPDQGFRQVVGLDKEEPVIVGSRQVLIYRFEGVKGRDYIEHREVRNALWKVQRHPVCDTSSPVVAEDGERVEAQSVHERGLIPGHGPLGVRGMILLAERLGTVAVAPQIRSNYRIVLGQLRCHQMPHRMRLRVAVQKQHRGSCTCADEIYLRFAGCYPSPLESLEHAAPMSRNYLFLIPNSPKERLDDPVEVVGDGLRLIGGLREIYGHDVVTPEGDHLAPLAVLDGFGGPQTVTGREDTVEGRGGAAALQVAEDHVARLYARARFDLSRQRLGDAAETDVSELVRLGVLGHELLGEGHALAYGDEAPLLAPLGSLFEDVGDLVQVRLDLGNEGNVRRAREASPPGDPTSVTSHHLDDHDPLVAFGRGAELVYGVGGYGDGGVVAEGGVGRREVVVYGLGAAHDLYPEVVVESLGDPERVIAADGHEGVYAEILHLLDDLLGVALVLVGVGARGAEDGAALLQDVAHAVGAQGYHGIFLGLEERLPAALQAVYLVAVVVVASGGDGPDHTVQSRGVAASGQHSYPAYLRHWLLLTSEIRKG